MASYEKETEIVQSCIRKAKYLQNDKYMLDVYNIEYIQKHINNCIPTFQKCIIPKNVSRTYAQLICEHAFVNP